MNAARTTSDFRTQWLRILIAIALVLVSWSHVLDQTAREHIDQSLLQATAVFAIARGLNGFLTVAKSTEVSSAVISFQPLEVLDPIHDLVEQFSSLMKIATISLVMQKLMLEFTATIPFKLLLTGFAAFFIVAALFNWTKLSVWAWRFVLYAFVVRFLFVALVLFNALLDASFLHEQTAAKEQDIRILSEDLVGTDDSDGLSRDERAGLLEESRQLQQQAIALDLEIEDIRDQIDELNTDWLTIESDIEKAPRTMLGRPRVDNDLKEHRDITHAILRASQQQERHLVRERDQISKRLERIQNTLDGRSDNSLTARFTAWLESARHFMRIARLKEQSDQLVDGIIALMALFLLRTVLFPILFLYLLRKLFTCLWRVHPFDALRRTHEVTLTEIHGRPTAP